MNRPRLTPRGQAFLAAGLTIAVIAMLFGFPDLTRIGVFLTCLPLMSLLLGWRRLPPLEIHRAVSPPLLAPGQEAQVRVEVRNRGRSSTQPHLVEETVDESLGPPPRLVLPSMAPAERHAARYRVRGRSRGAYPIGPLTLRQVDPFGLTSVRRQLPGRSQVVVLPRIERLADAGPLTGGVPGEGPVPHMVATQGEEDVTTRAYQEGDDLRRVHWPATAHRGELMVRQEEHPARRRAFLVLDARRSAHRGSGETSSFEWAVSALASVAVHLSDRGFELHLHCPATLAQKDLPLPLHTVLRHLALARLEDGELDPLLPAAEGLVVAAVAADRRAEEFLTRLAAPARRGGGILLLIDAPGFAAASDDDAAERLHRLAVAAGWRAHLVRRGQGVRQAWEHLRRDRVGA